MTPTKFDPHIHHRRSIRLKGYDYSQAGAYFVTIVAFHRTSLFGEIVDGEMISNDVGQIVQRVWEDIPRRFTFIDLGAFVVMPNHLHGIIIIHEPVGATHQAFTNTSSSPAPLSNITTGGINGSPLPQDLPDASLLGMTTDLPAGSPLLSNGPKSSSLGALMAQFKSRTTKRLWKIPSQHGIPVWQRNYYEHIIRHAREMDLIWRYIESNPSHWADDNENPHHVQS